MASSNRATSGAVVEKLQQVQAEPFRFGFLSFVRYLECVYDDRARVGEGVRPGDEPVRFSQEPSLAFAASTLASFEPSGSGQPARLAGHFFGLFGPNGPLPQHLTEYARDRERNFGDATFRAFCDIFHHRMTSFFYRAWANGQPTVSLDRQDARRFDHYVGALLGLAGEAFACRDLVPDDAKRYWVGRLGSSVKHADALRALLTEHFDVPFDVRELVGEWVELDDRDKLRLGGPSRSSTLGMTTVLGREIWSVQHRFQLVCGPLDLHRFEQFLPGSSGLETLRDLVRNYVGDEFAWDCRLLLKSAEVPALTLGRYGNLGWSSWLGERSDAREADDVVVDAEYRSPVSESSVSSAQGVQ